MRGHRVARGGLLLVGALGLLLATACQSSQSPCTPESSGFGAQTRITTRRALPGLDLKATCQPRVKTIRSDADLRTAYTDIGVKLLDATGHGVKGSIALPKVDWSTETVVLREATHEQDVSWIVTDGTNVTLGTQGCTGAGAPTCGVTMFAVPAIVTTAAAYACTDIGCGGTGGIGGE